MATRETQFNAEIGLFPFLKITATDVGALFKNRRRQGSSQPGPVMIVSVSSGLALDTAFHSSDGSHPHLWPPHGQPHQLWRLIASGHEGEVRIVSLSNGLFLDGRDGGDGSHTQMRGEEKNAAWQRWSLTAAPGNRSHYLVNAGTGRVLDSPHEAERGTWPVMWTKHDGENQRWLLTMPLAAPPDYSAPPHTF
ncbi:RICIN domain-containing protein [Streptomyces polygonati]|uniref:RICIN domain-containing protein n=1 Tax=Streptomyces polygonati TaxID=1617087 RepID=A0ABV8HKV2_9ACTN